MNQTNPGYASLTSTGSSLLMATALVALATAAFGAETPNNGIALDLIVDGETLQCAATGPVRLDPLTGLLTAQCDDGAEVACFAAPWDWALEADPLRFTAMCEAKSGNGFEVTVTPTTQNVQVGSTAQWQVRVKNAGPGPLSSVQISTTPATAGCNRTFANVNAGAQINYSCAMYNVPGNTSVQFAGAALRAGSPVNTAAIANIVTNGGGPGNPTAYIQMQGCVEHVSAGGSATWEVSLTNVGSQNLLNVTVTDTQASNCNRVLGTIASGATVSFQCSSSAPGPHTGLLKVTANHGAYMLVPPIPGGTSPGYATLPLLELTRSQGDGIFSNGFQP